MTLEVDLWLKIKKMQQKECYRNMGVFFNINHKIGPATFGADPSFAITSCPISSKM